MNINRKHYLRILSYLFCGASIFAVSATFADEKYQSLALIQLQADSFIHQHPYDSPYPVRAELGYIDNRLKLKKCLDPLNIQFSRSDKTYGRTAITVSCNTNISWKIHLPVKIDLYDDVLVAAQGLARGQIIDASKVVLKKVRVSDLNSGYFDASDSIQDYQVSRPLKRGEILSSRNLSPRMMVQSGQKVTLVLDFKGIQIKSSGLALRSARLGEVIKVRNLQSSRIVEGVVSGEATVRVTI